MNGLLFCYYGDDCTGSTDALEALAANGVRTALFVDPPDARMLARFADCQAVGIAGESRSRSPEWMSENLPAIFRSLHALGAPVCQYKVCSTFDSSPQCGSIGRAIEIGQEVFGSPWVPIVVAAPHLERFVLFGNLFAAAGENVYRIDRHPTMRQHPVTPMTEGDLRLHLAAQTNREIALLDIRALHGGRAGARLDALLVKNPHAVLFDGLDRVSLAETGRLLWSHAGGMFAAGSSGLTYALIEHWRAAGIIPYEPDPTRLNAVDRLIVISGSCSPMTELQVRRAVNAGFHGVRVSPDSVEEALSPALDALAEGRSVVLYTALGPGDCAGAPRGEALGRRLGGLLREAIHRSGVRRAVVAGGDTSSHLLRQLGVDALTYAAPLSPGVPLCRVHAAHPAMDGLELALKGGQVGKQDIFEIARKGTP